MEDLPRDLESVQCGSRPKPRLTSSTFRFASPGLAGAFQELRMSSKPDHKLDTFDPEPFDLYGPPFSFVEEPSADDPYPTSFHHTTEDYPNERFNEYSFPWTDQSEEA